MSLREKGLIVYAKVSKGSRPVVDAKVIAKITPVSDQSETQLCIELKDNGAGDPDMTKDDGVYSRYVEGIKNLGRHRLVVEAKSGGNAAVLRGATVPGKYEKKTKESVGFCSFSSNEHNHSMFLFN